VYHRVCYDKMVPFRQAGTMKFISEDGFQVLASLPRRRRGEHASRVRRDGTA
jgi:hypothetical protein